MTTQSMILKFILALFLTTSTLLSYEIPSYEMFWDLYKQKNIIGQNDCSNKSGRYARELHRLGYEVEVVILFPNNGEYIHAVVKATKNGRTIYLDPTKGIISFELLGIFIRSIPIDKLDSMGDSYK